MNEIEILKREEEMCHEIWEQNYRECNGNDVSLNHVHICDFYLLNLLYDGYGNKSVKSRKDAALKCKHYLKSIGEKRDPWWGCCDDCIHDRYITISRDNSTILNICTLGIDQRKLKQEDA